MKKLLFMILLTLVSLSLHASQEASREPVCSIRTELGPDIYIYRLPDGWLTSCYRGGVAYIPDPEHKWHPCENN
jgi:hypothetical protein